MYANTLGGNIFTSEPIVLIVPDGVPMEVNIFVKNKDISHIKVGDEVDIKLEAYPFSDFGTIEGNVSYISPSSTFDKNAGSYYLVKASIKNLREDIVIKSGMTGVAEIKVGKRSVLSYFLNPIIEGFGSSLKER